MLRLPRTKIPNRESVCRCRTFFSFSLASRNLPAFFPIPSSIFRLPSPSLPSPPPPVQALTAKSCTYAQPSTQPSPHLSLTIIVTLICRSGRRQESLRVTPRKASQLELTNPAVFFPRTIRRPLFRNLLTCSVLANTFCRSRGNIQTSSALPPYIISTGSSPKPSRWLSKSCYPSQPLLIPLPSSTAEQSEKPLEIAQKHTDPASKR